MKRDFRLNIEKLEDKSLLSINPWYVDTIHASEVWSNILNNSSRPVVAIVDSGADLTHPLLKDNLWHNPVDNSVGYDFVQNDSDPTGSYYHGTHVAGIIENVSNKSVDLMILRFMDNNGVGYVGVAAAAIDYATEMKLKGVNVVAINCSFGSLLSYSIPLADSIKRASDNGINVVIAAGNNGSDNDATPRYPCNLDYANNITVGAINPDLSLAGYSNYGKDSVIVAAPGTGIESSLPNNSYGSVSGTSMATAVVSGEVGLLAALGKYGASQIKSAIMRGCDYVVGLVDKIKCGLVNVAKSWNILKTETVAAPVPPIPSVPPVVIVNRIVYSLNSVSRSGVSGIARFTNSSEKPIVEIYINNVKRYSVVTNSNNTFNVSLNKKYFNLRKNLLEIRIKDSQGSLVNVVYKKYI